MGDTFWLECGESNPGLLVQSQPRCRCATFRWQPDTVRGLDPPSDALRLRFVLRKLGPRPPPPGLGEDDCLLHQTAAAWSSSWSFVPSAGVEPATPGASWRSLCQLGYVGGPAPGGVRRHRNGRARASSLGVPDAMRFLLRHIPLGEIDPLNGMWRCLLTGHSHLISSSRSCMACHHTGRGSW